MRKSIELTIFGVALGTYFMVNVASRLAPISIISVTVTHTLIACFIALFFPYISKMKQIILSALYPVSIILIYPALYRITLPLITSFKNIDKIFSFTEGGIRWEDPILPHYLIICALLQYFLEPFCFAWIYKRIGLYKKIPFNLFSTSEKEAS